MREFILELLTENKELKKDIKEIIERESDLIVKYDLLNQEATELKEKLRKLKNDFPTEYPK